MLWLATAIVHHANRVRENRSGVKVGGHQASSASMVSLMTRALVLRAARRGPGVGQAARLAGAARDQLPARPPRAPLPRDAARVRRPAELSRAAPRTPTRSTTRPARWASARPPRSGARSRAATSSTTASRRRRWAARSPWWATPSWTRARSGRRSPTPSVAKLGEVLWVVDLNRQSLDRVVPDIAFGRWAHMFEAAGWQTITVKYGARLDALFERPAGPSCAGASTRCPTRSTSACCAPPRRSCASGCPATTPQLAAAGEGARATASCAPRCATWAGTTRPS